MRRIFIIACIFLPIISSCRRTSCSNVPLDSVEVYYQPEAPWGRLRFETYGIDSLVLQNSPKFTINDIDSLCQIFRLSQTFHVDSSRQEVYEDAVIVAFLHYADSTDTLATNARPYFRMNYNSRPLHCHSMVMYLIDAVASRDPLWKESYDSLYYDDDFHYLSRSGMSQDQWLSD